MTKKNEKVTNIEEKRQETQEKSQKKNKILINKIKILNDGTAEISYKNSDDMGTGTVDYSGAEKVTDTFAKKFQETVDGFIGCIPALEREKSKIKMNAIKFDYGKSDKLQSALYSVKYAFNKATNAVINISTPLLPIFQEHFDEKTFCINGIYEQQLYELMELAKAYLKGDTRTKQTSLNLEVETD